MGCLVLPQTQGLSKEGSSADLGATSSKINNKISNKVEGSLAAWGRTHKTKRNNRVEVCWALAKVRSKINLSNRQAGCLAWARITSSSSKAVAFSTTPHGQVGSSQTRFNSNPLPSPSRANRLRHYGSPTVASILVSISSKGSTICLHSKGEKSVPDQMTSILEQWDTGSPNCAFKYYFYNKVSDDSAPLYRPGPNEDPKKWEEALSKKPGPGYIPVLCTGFAQMGERIKTQQRTLGNFNARLHEINGSLTALLQRHDTKISIRAMDAKRKHAVLKQRCLALATKVQVLRNRGYAMGGDEEDLKAKLAALDRDISDPALGARAEEIWARMITVQERAKLLKADLERTGAQSQNILDEETDEKAKKVRKPEQNHGNVLTGIDLGGLPNAIGSFEKGAGQDPAGLR